MACKEIMLVSLQEGHPYFKEHCLQGVVLGLGQVAAGLLRHLDVNWGKINATLPRDADPTSLTLEDAVTLLAAKAQGGGGGAQGRVLGQHPLAAISFCAKAALGLT